MSGPKGYGAYYFRANEQDPVVDWLRGLKESADMSDGQVKASGGPAVGTLGNWWSGKTKRPQFATIAATASAYGAKSIPILGKRKPNGGG